MGIEKVITMKERSDTPNDYNTLYPQTLDSQVKVDEEIAERFNLPTADAYNVFDKLSKYAQYAWKRRTANLIEVQNDLDYRQYVQWTANGIYVKHSTSITLNESGIPELVNPETTPSTSAAALGGLLQDFAPCYVQVTANDPDIYYLPEGTTYGFAENNTLYLYSEGPTLYLSNKATVKPKAVACTYQYGNSEFLFSSNPNAYPKFGVVDGYEYDYIGTPYENLMNPVNIEIGTYVGTGVKGESNKNTLTFNFRPKMVIVSEKNMGQLFGGSTSGTSGAASSFMAIYGTNQSSIYRYISHLHSSLAVITEDYTWDENNFSWYASTTATSTDIEPAVQFNTAGVVYYYIAIG